MRKEIIAETKRYVKLISSILIDMQGYIQQEYKDRPMKEEEWDALHDFRDELVRLAEKAENLTLNIPKFIK